MPATIRAQRCGACSFLGVECLSNCFWVLYIEPGEEEKFSVLVEDTSDEIFKAKVKKYGIDRRQNYIDNQYEYKKKMKSEREKAKAIPAALNQHEGKAVVDVAEDSLDHHEGKVVHDFGTGLKTRTRVPTPWSTKSCSNVAEDSLNHHEGKAVHDFGFKWVASKRVRTRRPTKFRSFSSFWTPNPLAEKAVGPSEKVVRLAEKAVGPSDSQLLLLAQCTEIYEFADMFSEENRTNILELKKKHDQSWFESMLTEMVNGVVQKAEQSEKEQASLRNEKAEQSETEQASLEMRKQNRLRGLRNESQLRNEKAEQAEKEQAERPEK